MNREQRLVHGFHGIACAGVATTNDLAAKRLENGACAFDVRLAAATHDRQRTCHGPFDSAAYRCINKSYSAPAKTVSDATRCCRIARCAINEECAFP